MTINNDVRLRAFLADEAGRAVASAPSFDEAVGRLADRIGPSHSGSSHRLIVLLAATLLLVAALGTAIAVGSGILRLPVVVDDPQTEPYEVLDGEVTYAAARPWAVTFTNFEGLLLNGNFEERIELVADPIPVATGCRQGPAPADAEALALNIRSDPDLEATAPVAIRVGGMPAVRMDVIPAPGASVCNWRGSQVLNPNAADFAGPEEALEQGSRMRLYLLDLPEGLSARILAIAIIAPEARFEGVVEAAAPIVDSFEFHVP
jgi:hypothetical protein